VEHPIKRQERALRGKRLIQIFVLGLLALRDIDPHRY
jgi:hypothetical protein